LINGISYRKEMIFLVGMVFVEAWQRHRVSHYSRIFVGAYSVG